MANAADDALLQALKDFRDRHTIAVGTIASDPRSGSTLLSATLQGRVQFTVSVADSSVSRSSGAIS